MSGRAPLQVLAVAGSLRAGSFNRALLRAAQALQPDGLQIEPFDLAPLPLFNQDLAGEHTPQPVQAWREALWAADALLIATPEYNHGVPGVLKNALDWASRPPGRQPLAGLPVAIMGATPNLWGTARAQAHLRQTLVYPDARVLSQPEVLIAHAAQQFGPGGELLDPATRGFVHELLVALADWSRQVGRVRPHPDPAAPPAEGVR